MTAAIALLEESERLNEEAAAILAGIDAAQNGKPSDRLTRAKRYSDHETPHNLEAERAVLAAALLDADAYSVAASVVTASDFFRDAYRRLFAAMGVLHRAAIPIDLVPLKDLLTRTGDLDQVGGPAEIARLTDGHPKGSRVAHYARIVREKSRQRTGIQTFTRAIGAIHEGRDADAVALVEEWSERTAAADDETLLEPLAIVAERVATGAAATIIEGLLNAKGNTVISASSARSRAF